MPLLLCVPPWSQTFHTGIMATAFCLTEFSVPSSNQTIVHSASSHSGMFKPRGIISHRDHGNSLLSGFSVSIFHAFTPPNQHTLSQQLPRAQGILVYSVQNAPDTSKNKAGGITTGCKGPCPLRRWGDTNKDPNLKLHKPSQDFHLGKWLPPQGVIAHDSQEAKTIKPRLWSAQPQVFQDQRRGCYSLKHRHWTPPRATLVSGDHPTCLCVCMDSNTLKSTESQITHRWAPLSSPTALSNIQPWAFFFPAPGW